MNNIFYCSVKSTYVAFVISTLITISFRSSIYCSVTWHRQQFFFLTITHTTIMTNSNASLSQTNISTSIGSSGSSVASSCSVHQQTSWFEWSFDPNSFSRSHQPRALPQGADCKALFLSDPVELSLRVPQTLVRFVLHVVLISSLSVQRIFSFHPNYYVLPYKMCFPLFNLFPSVQKTFFYVHSASVSVQSISQFH